VVYENCTEEYGHLGCNTVEEHSLFSFVTKSKSSEKPAEAGDRLNDVFLQSIWFCPKYAAL
jgi:hypothetical protein